MNNFFQICNNDLFKDCHKKKCFKKKSPKKCFVKKCSRDNKSDLKDNEILYWEKGNRLIKMCNFNKIMNRNLTIMYYVDKIFCEFLNSTRDNSYKNLIKHDCVHKFPSGNIEITNGNIIAQIAKNKCFPYKVINVGYTRISKICIDDDDLCKNKIPSLESIIYHNHNICHMVKIIEILKLKHKYHVYNNTLDCDFNFNEFTEIDRHIDNIPKNDLLKSHCNTGFYIKIYKNHGKAFFIDNENRLIYYIAISENFNKNVIDIRYYIFKIVDGKIQ
jgi:hypothetical protein